MKKILLTAAAVLSALYLHAAVQESAGIMFPALEIGAGARAAGMGDAYTAVADDASAAYWNTAGLGWIKRAEVSLTYDKWFVDSFFQHVMASVPLSTGAMGFDIFYMNYGSFDRVDSTGLPAGASMNPFNMEGMAAYGIQLGKQFSLGIGAKFLSTSLDKTMTMGFAGDLGLMFKTGSLSLGMAIQNLGIDGAYPLPISVNVGAGYGIIRSDQHSLLVSADLKYVMNDMPSVCAGLEYKFMDIVAIRGGYRFGLGQDNLSGLKDFTAGAGIKLGSFGFDYAFAPYGELGMAQRAAVSYSFGRAAEPPAAAQPRTKPQEKAAAKPGKTQDELNDMLAEAGTMENSGKLKDAELKYREIIAYDRNFADAYKRLGAVYYKEGRKADAVSTFATYLKLKPDDSAVANWMKKHRNEK
jgi:hypothetical protein